MNVADAEEYTQSLGQIVAGSWRQVALAKRLGVPKALGLTLEEWVTRLGGYTKLSIEERREAVTNLTADGLSTRETAEILGVSHQTVARDVTNVTGKEAPIDAVAALAADETIRRQADKSAKREIRREERFSRIVEISKGNAELPTSVRYPIVYADPPWRYEAGTSSPDRAVENHYPTMSLEEICALPVAELATDSAMLFLWCTAPKLAEAMAVIESWDFIYRSGLVWDKKVMGMGYYARIQHEHLLIARRGDIPAPKPGKQPRSIYSQKRGKHSVKPIHFAEVIERAYPGLPKIELFARTAREGWAAWGNQAEWDAMWSTPFVETATA